MSLTVEGAPTATGGTSATSTTTQWWRRWRTAIGVGLLVVLAGLAVAALRLGGNADDLDPTAPTHNGSRALAHLLRDRGVDVRRTVGVAATTTDARPGDTILIIAPDVLTVEQAQEMRSTGANLVVVDTEVDEVLSALLPGASTGRPIQTRARDAGCDLSAARLAGRATTGGQTYRADEGTRCYAGSVVQVTASGQTTTLLGSGTALRNDHLAKEGNAALTMNLLGEGPRLFWSIPSIEDAETAPRQSLLDLLPDWVGPTVLELFIAVLLVAGWRARRLGPVVEEPLPVVVRAAELTEGRARLYRRARARDRAASELRRATVGRLAPLLAVPGGPGSADPVTVAQTAADRTGREPGEVMALLYGGVPADDAALVALADHLDRIEREVRRT